MVLSSSQVRAWDEFTIRTEPVSSLNLMERAAAACVRWLEEKGYAHRSFAVFCGKGNNGGDGLAIARMLAATGCPVTVYILEFGHKGTEDFQQNLARLHGMPVDIRFIQSEITFPALPDQDIIIDALLGAGLNRPLEGVTAALVNFLNASGHEIISIDIPSGLFVDKSSKGNIVTRARHTLSFQCYKLAFLVAENEDATGQVHIIDIGLHAGFLQQEPPAYGWIDAALVRRIYKPRKRFSHKGTYGHALLIAGSYGKIGAAVLAARACMRSGVGLLTVQVPHCGLAVLQTALPEAMCRPDENEQINTSLASDPAGYTAIGIGPGLGVAPLTAGLLQSLLEQIQGPLVLDADALNIIQANPRLLSLLPSHTILTPHPKEFERLFGSTANDFERMTLAIQKAVAHQVIIVLKGQYTLVACPSGRAWFNTTGNAGLATGGTGDVLTGIITGLLAQRYTPEQAALFGVFWHGLAGDIASGYYTPESLIASDIPEALGRALQQLIVQQ